MSGRPSLRAPLILLVALALARWGGFGWAVWLVALLSLAALREYLSLADLRPEDRWAMLACYLAVPLVFRLVQTDWYGFFIVSVPVWVFVLVPVLAAAGGRETRGLVFSIGALDFGLFLLVYCLAHFVYLARFSPALALLVLLAALLCDALFRMVRRAGGGGLLTLVASWPPVFLLAAVLGRPAGLTGFQVLWLTAMLPPLVLLGDFTLSRVETDLGIDATQLEPGRGRLIHGLRPLLFAAPIVFHTLRYATELL